VRLPNAELSRADSLDAPQPAIAGCGVDKCT
jgi:hypothetical protein